MYDPYADAQDWQSRPSIFRRLLDLVPGTRRVDQHAVVEARLDRISRPSR